MNPRIQDSRVRVQNWLESLDLSVPVTHESTPGEAPEPLAKRARREREVSKSADDDFAHPFNTAPDTPPHTECTMDEIQLQSPSSGRGQKRVAEAIASSMDPGVDDDDDVFNDTPKPKPRRLIHQSPKKKLKRSRAILDQLRKPFLVHAIPNYSYAAANLASDILPLYRQFLAASDREKIIPYEVRDEVAAVEWHLPRYFRDPNPADITGTRAKAAFEKLRAINRSAAESQTFQRHECSWNNLVHTPLLQLAFGSDILERNEVDTVSVRCEPAMSATIVGDSIPFLKHGSTGARSELACSVSLDSRLLPSDDGSYLDSDVSISMLRSRGAKVDYTIVIDVSEDDPLRKKISQLIHRTEGLPHVNQTAYLPLKDSPIAASIEAKVEMGAEDPMIQLGIWTVAWYQRMYDLREALVGAGPKPQLVSVPIIQVVAHNWYVYFVCDATTSIEVYGPVSLGSTENMTSMYVLLRSLEAIKEWMLSVFYNSLKTWFVCDEIPERDKDNDKSV